MKKIICTIIFLIYFGTLSPQQIILTEGLISEKNIEETHAIIKKRIKKKFGRKASEQFKNYLIEYSFQWSKKSKIDFKDDFTNKLDSLIENRVPLREYLNFGGIIDFTVYDDSLKILCIGDSRSLLSVEDSTYLAKEIRKEIREILKLEPYVIFNPSICNFNSYYLILKDFSIIKKERSMFVD